MINHFITNCHFRDLNPLLFGQERCRPGHSFGPAIREYYLIHYVERGRGVYETDGRRYSVQAGEAFLILPGKVTRYTADADDPWSYRWIGFDGELAKRFDALPPVFALDGDAFPDFPDPDDSSPEYHYAAALFRLSGALFGGNGTRRDRTRGENRYVRQVQSYIRLSYMHPDLRVEEMARQMNLNRRYLSRLFRRETGLTPQAFLVAVRMQEADRYLRQGMTVGETARLCGYADVFNFSRMFKKTYGVSPVSRMGRRERP